MPRPDKDINPGSLDGPSSSSRSESWTKYGGPETAGGSRGAPSSVDSVILEVTVDDITVIEHSNAQESKYTTRGTAAHGIGLPEDKLAGRPIEFVPEWTVERTIEGRVYHRIDTLVMVQTER